jgi:hypothetical protein
VMALGDVALASRDDKNNTFFNEAVKQPISNGLVIFLEDVIVIHYLAV